MVFNSEILNRFTSRKFLLALASAVLIVLNEGLGLGINKEVYWAILVPVVSFIVVEGAKDIVENLPANQ